MAQHQAPRTTPFWRGGVHHWATPKDLSGLQAPVLTATERMITDAGVTRISSGLMPAGTLLMSSRAPIGYLAIAAMPVAINQGFIAMPPGGTLSPVWLLFWAKTNMEAIKQKANGSTFMEISKAAFRPIKIALPPPETLSRFDEVAAPMLERVKNNERHISTLAALRDTLLPRLISGQLRVRQ
ncbi:MAG: restriction endonuclease subunit S [Proteobacteria bacterium]|nr:restriction endonuclease subunit S [Pseudomonadota bacterium]